MRKLLLLSLLCASVALAHSTIILNWLQTETVIDDEAGTTNTVSTVCFSLVDKFGAPFTTAIQLPQGYTAQDLSNAVAAGSARLAEQCRVTEWTPETVKLP